MTQAVATIGHNNPPPLAEQLKERHAPLFDRLKRVKAKIGRVRDLQPQNEADCSKLEEAFAEARDLANDAERARTTEKEPHLTAGKEIDGLFNGEFRDGLGTEKNGEARALADRAAKWRYDQAQAAQREAAKAAAAAAAEAQRLAEQAQRQDASGKTAQADVTFARAEAQANAAAEAASVAQADTADLARSRTAGGRSVGVSMVRECTAVNLQEIDLNVLRPYLKAADLVDAVNRGIKAQFFTGDVKGAVIVERIAGRVR